MTHFWEDVDAGGVTEYGSIIVTREDIIAFARRYDPQSFHVNEAAAREHPFGGLIASGLHTASVCMRLLVDNVLVDAASLGSPGIRRLRWPQPVRPGDTLRVRQHTLSKRRSRSRPDVGLLDNRFEVLNQRDEVVMIMESTALMRVRNPEACIDD